MKNESLINQEAFHGILPLLHRDRPYGFIDMTFVLISFGLATWVYLQGGYLASMLGLKLVVASALLGFTLGVIFLGLAATISTRYGIDLWIYMRAMIGFKGVKIFFIFLNLVSTGWLALNAQFFANSMMRIAEGTGVAISSQWMPWIALIGILAGSWIAYNGPTAVKWANRIMVPSLLLVGLVIMVLVFTNASLKELASIVPIGAGDFEDIRTPFMLSLEWNLAFSFSFLPVLGVLPRLIRSERGTYWSHFIAYGFVLTWFIILGALTSILVTSMTGELSLDPTEWLVELGGPVLGLLSLVAVGVANISTHAVAMYSTYVSTKVINPKWNYKHILFFWTIWVTLLTFWGGVWNYYQSFIAVIGVLVGPGLSLVLVDYFVIRRKKLSLHALYDTSKSSAYYFTGGFNLAGIISLFAGVAGYLLVYNPITFMPKSIIFMYLTATGFASIVTVLVYIILVQFNAVQKYNFGEGLDIPTGSGRRTQS